MIIIATTTTMNTWNLQTPTSCWARIEEKKNIICMVYAEHQAMVFIWYDVYDEKENDWMWPCFVFVCVNCVVYIVESCFFLPICNFGSHSRFSRCVCVCLNRLFYTLETHRLLHHFHWEWAYALQTVQHYANSVCFHKIHTHTHTKTPKRDRERQCESVVLCTHTFTHIHTTSMHTIK